MVWINSKVLLGLVSMIILVPANQSFAETTEFTKIEGNDLSQNPTAQKILEQIDLSKKILADLKEGKVRTELTEQQKFIEEQRRLAKERLEQDLSRMNKEYEPYTPRNAYASFLTGVNSTHHEFYWDMFDQMDNRVQIAKAAKEKVLANGGTVQEALSAYIKYASMTRHEMIEINKELNIKHGFTDDDMQSYFDKNGKLPRYEDDPAICYSCERFVPISERLIEEGLQTNPNS